MLVIFNCHVKLQIWQWSVNFVNCLPSISNIGAMHLDLQRSNKAIAWKIHLSNERVPRASPKLIKIHTKILIRGGLKMVDPIKCSRDKIYKKEHLVAGKPIESQVEKS